MVDPDLLFTNLCRSGLDLNVRQLGILLACTAAAGRAPDSREVHSVASFLGLHKSAITRNCDRLVEIGLIGRVRLEEDGRRRMLVPTEDGLGVAERVRDGMKDARPALRSGTRVAA